MKTRLTLIVATVVMQLLGASAQEFLTNGLVGYYPFNGNANDESGNGNHGIVNGAQLGIDRFSNTQDSYLFTAYPQSIATSSAAGFPVGSNDFSISLWVSLTALSDDHQILFCNGAVNDFQLTVSPTTTGTDAPMDFITGGHYGSPDVHTADVSWVPDYWYNLQIVRSQNTVTIYRNTTIIGQAQTSNGVNAPTESRYLQFGLGVPPQLHQFHGQLDDIRVYNRALSAEEVSELYYQEAPSLISIAVSQVRLCWPVATGKTYQLQYRSESTTNMWVDLGSPIVGTGTNFCTTDDVSGAQKFYRLQITE